MLSELSVQIFWPQVIIVTKLVLVHDVGEIFEHELLLLFVEDVDFSRNLLEPRMG
jgi:hypothetical protein